MLMNARLNTTCWTDIDDVFDSNVDGHGKITVELGGQGLLHGIKTLLVLDCAYARHQSSNARVFDADRFGTTCRSGTA